MTSFISFHFAIAVISIECANLSDTAICELDMANRKQVKRKGRKEKDEPITKKRSLGELREQISNFVREHLTSNGKKEMNRIVDEFDALDLMPDGKMIYVVCIILREILGKSDVAHQHAIDFLVIFKTRKLCSILNGFQSFMKGLRNSQLPNNAANVASILCCAVASKLISLHCIGFLHEKRGPLPSILTGSATATEDVGHRSRGRLYRGQPN